MVFFLEDPLTGDVPHRGLVEEEDEQRAAEVAPQYSAAPEVQVCGQAQGAEGRECRAGCRWSDSWVV